MICEMTLMTSSMLWEFSLPALTSSIMRVMVDESSLYFTSKPQVTPVTGSDLRSAILYRLISTVASLYFSAMLDGKSMVSDPRRPSSASAGQQSPAACAAIISQTRSPSSFFLIPLTPQLFYAFCYQPAAGNATA